MNQPPDPTPQPTKKRANKPGYPKGRPQARPIAPGRGRKPRGHIAITIHLPPEAVDALDARRGNLPRGQYIARRIAAGA